MYLRFIRLMQVLFRFYFPNRLTGTLSIPEDASQSLVGAFFFENQITGTIPTELATLSALSKNRPDEVHTTH